MAVLAGEDEVVEEDEAVAAAVSGGGGRTLTLPEIEMLRCCPINATGRFWHRFGPPYTDALSRLHAHV